MDQEWIVWEVDANGAPLKLIRNSNGVPIVTIVKDAAQVILIVYSIWEPLKKMISDIWNAIFRKRKKTDGPT